MTEDSIVFNDENAIAKIRNTMFPTFRDGMDVAIARYRRGNIIAGVVYSDYYRHHSISMFVHSWEKHWLNRDFLFVIFDYPFNQLHVKHIFASARDHMTPFEFHIGFRPVARVEGFYPDADKVIMRMDREDCRHLNIVPRHLH